MPNNMQVAHLWAAQQRSTAKGSHFYFEGGSLYSYSTEIARIVEGRFILTDQSYSVTTSKHQGYARRAVNGPCFSIYLPFRNIPFTMRSWEDFAPIVFDTKILKIKTKLDELSRTRTYHTALSRDIASLARDALLIRADNPSAAINQELGISFERLERIATLETECAASGDPDLFFAELLKLFADDLKLDRDKLKSRVKQAQAGRSREQALLKERQRTSAESYSDFRKNFLDGLPLAGIKADFSSADFPTLIRLIHDGATVQTSRGAEVPTDEAIQLWGAYIRDPRSVIGQRIGDFTVNGADTVGLNIGCHYLLRSALEPLASMLIESKNRVAL